MITKQALAEQHNLWSETRFRSKVLVHMAGRMIANTLAPSRKSRAGNQLTHDAVISFSETDLWNSDDNAQNWILTAGKVENLRVAVRKLNGIEVSANTVFSFWKHIGYPGRQQGFVTGREIREGCIVPTIAGGLCQLSNSLYDAALKAGFTILERHRHTRVIRGSLAEQDRDATVKWNYVDLRFKASQPFRIEAELTADKLILKFRGLHTDAKTGDASGKQRSSSNLNDCYSCGNFSCFKHPDRSSVKQEAAITTYILDDRWPEYDTYIQSQNSKTDVFIVPMLNGRFIKNNRYHWSMATRRNARALTLSTLQRALLLRFFIRAGRNVFSSMLKLDAILAKAAARKIPIESTHLVIAQNLLPFLWRSGALGGRTFDVLMTRLPIEKLHERLDFAHQHYPDSKTLNDFRADAQLMASESTALTKARKIITPHQEIAAIFNHKSIKLDWAMPTVAPKPIPAGNKILFPASALGRKGAYEIRQLLQHLPVMVVITGRANELPGFFEGLNVTQAGTNPLEGISLVVYPTYIEHQPRLLLKAIAAGLPVITTAASGLVSAPNITIIPTGNYEALQQAVKKHLGIATPTIAAPALNTAS